MRKIIFILATMSSAAFADISPMTDPSDLGFSDSKVEQLIKEHEGKVDVKFLSERIASSFEDQSYMSAAYTDQAMRAIITQASEVLTHYGYTAEAKQISAEYREFYTQSFSNMYLGVKELGDHAPLSKWVDGVHTKIEDSIGEYLCKYFHLHDMYILNYGVPSVFHASTLSKKDYMDAFAGHLIWGWFWEHAGVTGVVTYWAVNMSCAAGTSGMGVVAFICGPISGWAERGMDRVIAPPIGGRIWERAHAQLGNLPDEGSEYTGLPDDEG